VTDGRFNFQRTRGSIEARSGAERRGMSATGDRRVIPLEKGWGFMQARKHDVDDGRGKRR
jgi:hypothetical protein